MISSQGYYAQGLTPDFSSCFHKYSNKKLSRGEPPNFSGQHLMHGQKLLHEIADRANGHSVRTGNRQRCVDDGAESKSRKGMAVEYDAKFVDSLKRKTAQHPNTKIIHQDIMKMLLGNP